VPPSPRGGHTAVVHGDRIYTFGGKSGRSPFNDLCCLDLPSGVWEAVRAGSPAPAPRCAHVSVVHGGSLLIFGGYDGRHYFSDCFEWPLEADRGAASQALAGDLECMVESGQFSDILFEVEGKTVPAHTLVEIARDCPRRSEITTRVGARAQVPPLCALRVLSAHVHLRLCRGGGTDSAHRGRLACGLQAGPYLVSGLR